MNMLYISGKLRKEVSSVRIAICDDEKICRDSIAGYIAQFDADGLEMTVTEFGSGEEIIRAYESGQTYDVVFLDVEMPGASGVDAGRTIRETDAGALLIFVTGHTKYVPEAFRLQSFQFLVKPLEQKVFIKEFTRAVQTYKKMKSKYKIVCKGNEITLEIKDIIHIETSGRHLKAVTANAAYEYWGNISAEEKRFAPCDFVRCHRAYLVNMHYIRNLNKNLFVLSNGGEIPISKQLKNQTVERYNKFISGVCI